MDLTQSIAPKSDQLNAEDLLSGPRTFTIAEVRKGSDEQPVDVHLVEHPGRPFKPSKTVRRLMVAAWGVDSATYTGQRMTLYRDPAVKFGGMDVGGIRVSHMSGIDKPLKVALTVSRGKRAPYVVQPLSDTPTPQPQPSNGERARREAQMLALLTATGHTDKEDMLAFVSTVAARTIEKPADLTDDELSAVITELQVEQNAAEPQTLDVTP